MTYEEGIAAARKMVAQTNATCKQRQKAFIEKYPTMTKDQVRWFLFQYLISMRSFEKEIQISDSGIDTSRVIEWAIKSIGNWQLSRFDMTIGSKPHWAMI